MATKRVRGGVWHYTVKRKGVLPKPIYLSFPTEAEGDEYVRRLEALLDRGVVPEEFFAKREVSKTVRDGVRRYLATQHVSQEDNDRIAVALRFLPADLGISDLTFSWASAWVTTLKREHNLAPSTLRKYVGCLARCFDWLAGHGELLTNPLRLLPKGYATYTPDDERAVAVIDGRAKEDTERDRRLEEGEEDAIRAVLAGAKAEGKQRALELREAPALALLFDAALESAMRMREMYTLAPEQVDLARRTIFLDKTKNGDKRQVPITTVLLALLTNYLPTLAPGAPLVFPWWDGERSPESLKRTTSQLSRQYARIFETAGCADLHFHDLRHEATSRLYERTTLSDLQIAKITGHKDLKQLKRYANLRASNLADQLW